LTLLNEARAACLHVQARRGRLVIRGPRHAESVARRLLANKAVVLNALECAATGVKPDQLPADWHFLWDERAAIMEYDGGLPREHAEAEGLKYIIAEMRQAGISQAHDT
jgi:hypothetical protein